MTTLQAIVMAILQGITELFPISSLGHAVILPALLHWGDIEKSADWLPFLAVMHLGTAIALLGYFWKDWLGFAVSVVRFSDPDGEANRRLFMRVVVATIPAVVIGFLFEKLLRGGFANPKLAALFLIINGGMLFVAERKRGKAHRGLADITWLDATIIGIWQCLALIPGMSRSGATMAGGYMRGLNHQDAARFSFLTATPIILGAVALEAPKLIHHGGHFGAASIIAGVVAGITALLSVIALMRWFKRHEVEGFMPFAIYCGVGGLAALFLLSIMH
jgi:undecaprenyl-diphosphatase